MIALSRMLLRAMVNVTIGQCKMRSPRMYIYPASLFQILLLEYSCSNTPACTERLSIYVLLASALLTQARIMVISFSHLAILQSTYLARINRPIKTNPDTPNKHLQAQSHRTYTRIRKSRSNSKKNKNVMGRFGHAA